MYNQNQNGIIQTVLVIIVVVAAAAALGTGIYLNNLVAKLDSSADKAAERQETPFTNIPIISQIPQFAGGPAATPPAPTAKPEATAKPTAKPIPTPTPSPVPAKAESCPKVETLACFSTSPICKKFPSPCQIPSDWRIVE